jgi:6-phosphogluconolactonase (cycloisomerase 2 family)
VVRVNSSGHLSPPTQVIDHNPLPVTDCEGAHVHEVVLSGANQSSLEVMDLGLDTVSHYSTTDDHLVRTPPRQVISMPRAGSGPRHMAIHPSAPWAFVLNELDSTLSSLPCHRGTGALGPVAWTVSALRPGEDAADMAAGGERVRSKQDDDDDLLDWTNELLFVFLDVCFIRIAAFK